MEVAGQVCNWAAGAGAVIAGLALVTRPSGRRRLRSPEHLLALLLFAVSLPTIFLATPMWYQYWGFPVAFLLAWLAVLVGLLWHEDARVAGTLLGLVLVVTLVGEGYNFARAVRQVGQIQYWAGVALHRAARQAAAETPRSAAPERLACMQQLFAIESGRFQPYPELAYAPFTYVIADRIPQTQRRRLGFVGPNELDRLLDGNPPAAILTGLYAGLYWPDADLAAWGRRAGYREAGLVSGWSVLVRSTED